MLIGDRVTVNAVKVDGSAIVVDYLDRRPGEPLTSSPSVPTSKRLAMRDGKLTAQ